MGDVRVNLEGSDGIRSVAAGKNQRLFIAVQRQWPIAGADAFPAVFIGKNCGIFQKIPGGKGDGQRLQSVKLGSLIVAGVACLLVGTDGLRPGNQLLILEKPHLRGDRLCPRNENIVRLCIHAQEKFNGFRQGQRTGHDG